MIGSFISSVFLLIPKVLKKKKKVKQKTSLSQNLIWSYEIQEEHGVMP